MTPHPRIARRLVGAAALLTLSIPFVGIGATPAQARARTRTRQQPPPAADATVEGVVLRQDGSPAKGVDVSVEGHDDAGLAGAIAFIFSFGLACIADSVACFGSSTDGSGGTTEADGGYRSSLPNSYVAGTETDTDWVVTAALPPAAGQVAGPRSSFEFEVNIALQAAAPLPLWEQTPSIALDGWHATVSVDGPPPAGTSRPTVSVGGSGEGPLTAPGSTATVDLRLLESSDDAEPLVANVTSYADVRVPHANGRTIYHQAVSTATVALPPVDLVPPSRGAPCSFVIPVGAPAPEPGGRGCPVTDGDRWSSVPTGATSVTVELPSVVEAADAFVAGCPLGCTVEVSADGAAWSAFTPGRSGPATRPVVFVASSAASQSARLVRVSSPEGLDRVVEISVWPVSPPRPAARPPATQTPAGEDFAAPRSSPTALEARTSSDGDGTSAPVAAALAAIALAGASVGVAVVWARGHA